MLITTVPLTPVKTHIAVSGIHVGVSGPKSVNVDF